MPERRQCRARNRAGKQCGRAPIWGGAVCYFHGGRAPQVRRKAAKRLREVTPSLWVREAIDMWERDMPLSIIAAWFDISEQDVSSLFAGLALAAQDLLPNVERTHRAGHPS